MKIKIEKEVEINLHEFASQLAMGNSDDQAQFFNAFAVTLAGCCGSDYKAGLQMCYVADDSDHPLTDSAKEIFSYLSGEYTK